MFVFEPASLYAPPKAIPKAPVITLLLGTVNTSLVKTSLVRVESPCCRVSAVKLPFYSGTPDCFEQGPFLYDPISRSAPRRQERFRLATHRS